MLFDKSQIASEQSPKSLGIEKNKTLILTSSKPVTMEYFNAWKILQFDSSIDNKAAFMLGKSQRTCPLYVQRLRKIKSRNKEKVHKFCDDNKKICPFIKAMTRDVIDSTYTPKNNVLKEIERDLNFIAFVIWSFFFSKYG